MKYRFFALLLGLVCLSFFYFGTSHVAIFDGLTFSGTQQSDQSWTFTASDPGTDWLEDDLNRPDGKRAAAGALFNTGDGGFFLGSLSDFSTFSYHYNQAGTPSTWLEVTPKYDNDGKKPKRLLMTGPFTPTTSTTANPVTNLLGKNILLQASRNPSPGDVVNYVISFHADALTTSGEFVRFEFDPTVFSLSGIEEVCNKIGSSNSGMTPATRTSINNNSVEQLEWPLAPNWAGDGTIIVTLTTMPNATVSNSVAVRAAIVLKSDDGTPNSSTGVDALTQTVVESHDPNFKTVSPNRISQNTTTLTYTIHFQNDGTGPADSICIHDIFDREVKASTIQILDWKPRLLKIQTKPAIQNQKTGCESLDFVFDSVSLPGLGQIGCGHLFPIDSTMGFIKFSVEVDRSKLKPCSAILNEADIYFSDPHGAKPAVHTTQAVCQIPCQTNNDTCSRQPDTTFSTIAIQTGQSTQPNFSYWLPSDFTDIKWYPCEGIDATDPRRPVFNPTRPIAYTCVASTGPTGCKQRFLHQLIKPTATTGNGNTGWPMGWIWAILLAFLGILAAFFFGKKKPPVNKGQQQGY